jgi:superoxide reductase
VKHGGGGDLVCCGKKMTPMEITKNDVGEEKHLPVVENIGYGKYQIIVGSTRHPMTPEHYIEWVEVSTSKNEKIIKFFDPGDSPEFIATISGKITKVEALCNTHGLWSISPTL